MLFVLLYYQNHQLLQTGFLRDTILPEICAFSLALAVPWTKMRSLACSLADGVLADAILIPHCQLMDAGDW